MERLLMKNLIEWKNNPKRKPLILNGARQVGKTWILKEFGKQHFDNVAYINLDTSSTMRELFNSGYDIDRIISSIKIKTGQPITKNKTLIILDEIQECPKALTSLKYFCEEAPEYAVAAAGSLLGITIHEGTGYPVGKVNTLNLYPLSFKEFLMANGQNSLLQLFDTEDKGIINAFSEKMSYLLKQYYYVGGMPEAVQTFLDTGHLENVRNIQLEILKGYELDISKHLNRTETEYTLAALNSIPAHLSQENKRFIFGHISQSARARNFKAGITWLTQAGIVTKVQRVSKPNMPLKAYSNNATFKLFMLDVGLLGAMANLDEKSTLKGNLVYKEFKGALTEQYVCQQLIAENEIIPFYWSAENSSGEIDFLVQDKSNIFAIEVKSEENLKSKSLRAFKGKYPEVKALRFSLSGYRDQDWMRNIPLYAISNQNLWKTSKLKSEAGRKIARL